MMRRVSILICAAALMLACTSKKNQKLFEIYQGSELGISFQNTIVTSDTFNAVTFEYIYNGSGVGVGDFNQDGLPDLFFGGNQVSSQLYINQGDLKFKDVTQQANVSTDRWVTGVSVVDINADGLEDIYLSVAGKTNTNRKNILFINQGSKGGMPQFKEMAKSYGLDDDRYSTMAAFFDYDKDGDLDMYLVNNWLESFNRNNLRKVRMNGEAESTDQLYRNNGDGTFSNVSREVGILIEGYGLGVTICDINQDSWPDVYVSNDFMSNDLIWVNQQDGTFKNLAGEYLKHQTHNGMGVDIADFNNDALPDIMEVDMLPPDHKRQKLMTAGQNYDHFHMAIQLGYQPQYMRNTLQLNRGKLPDGGVAFSEIAFMAGVAKTDWSWAPLFADFDNDGWKDIFIGNGYRKDVTNLDFIFFSMKGNPFGTPEARRKKYLSKLAELEEVQTTNYVFRNTGSLAFEDVTKTWGAEFPTYSNGAAYADFDNDGDLDLVTNNIDQEVVFYKNVLNEQREKNNFLQVRPADTKSLNQKIWVYTYGLQQYQELTPYRGFQSSVSGYAHFGLGENSLVDSVIIEWTDGARAKYTDVKPNTVLIFSRADARPYTENIQEKKESYFQKYSPVSYTHIEKSPSDIKVTRTLLHELSRYGPCIAAGDVNADSLDDLFIGGEVGTASRLFIQRPDGTFSSKTIVQDSIREDGAAHFFDADADGDLDLYVASACPSISEEAAVHQLYFNDGKGNFVVSNTLPVIRTSASCVISSDFDKDGDLDLFVGGRITPLQYPLPPRSYILQNKKGTFTDITAQVNPQLENPGMVASAVWADYNNDKKMDLILTGEWMPVRIFKNDTNKFIEVTNEMGLKNTDGWWNCLQAADLNNDGYIDLIAGNTGRNSYFQPTMENPLQLIAKDFDSNGSVDPVITYFNSVEQERFIVHNRMVLIDQIPPMKKRFETFTQYATTPFDKAFRKDELDRAYQVQAFTLASCVLVNNKGTKFEAVELPEIAQLSSINDILTEDINLDGHTDLLLIGNSYSQETLFGRYDASLGTLLLGNSKLQWKNDSPSAPRIPAGGNAKYIRMLRTHHGKAFVVANNNSAIDFFNLKGAKK
jgi:hypothetical protein